MDKNADKKTKEQKKAKEVNYDGLFENSLNDGRPVLLGSKCKACGKITFPPKIICFNCFGDMLEKVYLSRRGKLYTYTILEMAPDEGFEAPYAIGYIDLPEGIRVFSKIVNWESGLKIGIDMELVIGKIRKDRYGEDVICYMFRPSLS